MSAPSFASSRIYVTVFFMNLDIIQLENIKRPGHSTSFCTNVTIIILESDVTITPRRTAVAFSHTRTYAMQCVIRSSPCNAAALALNSNRVGVCVCLEMNVFLLYLPAPLPPPAMTASFQKARSGDSGNVPS